MVSFLWLNLASMQAVSGVGPLQKADVIFCRNVLMYFTSRLIHQTASFFYDFLCDPGWLITSQVELNDQYFGMFRPVSCGNCQVYQKSSLYPASPVLQHSTEKFKTKVPAQVSTTIPITPKPVQKSDRTGNKAKTVQPDPQILYETGQYRACADLCLTRIRAQVATERQFILFIRSTGNLGELTVAKNACEEMIAKNPVNATFHYLYATILLESGDHTGSLNALKKVIYLEPEHLMGHFIMFNLLKKKGEHKHADLHRKNVIQFIKNLKDNDPVPGTEGMTAGSLRQIAGILK